MTTVAPSSPTRRSSLAVPVGAERCRRCARRSRHTSPERLIMTRHGNRAPSLSDGTRSRPYDAAHAKVFEAECALRDGDRELAGRVLVDAHATARRLGAETLRRRCEATARRGHLPTEAAGHPLPPV